MRKTLFIGLALFASAVSADSVNGYWRNDGTYVEPYHRSSPNSRLYDNYNSQGNVNPYTGQYGTQPNEFSNPPAYNQWQAPSWGVPDRSSGFR